MITADELSLIPRQIQHDGILKRELREIFKEIVDDSRYKKWFEYEQFSGQLFQLSQDYEKNKLLQELNLVKRGNLQVKVHSFQDHIFLTDGLWIPGRYRVFPFFDESKNLIQHMKAPQLDNVATTVIDPACGCGHHSLLASKIQQKFSFDVSYRALIYTSLNAIINNVNNISIKQNDITDGIPEELNRLVTNNILFLINMPFAIAPLPNILPLTADGGTTGAKWTFKALEAIKKFADNNQNKESIHASILCYTVGNQQQDEWEVVDKAKQLFGDSKISWTLLKDQTMWRINGKKEQPNPMNLAEGLPKKADCPFYVSDKNDRELVRTKYNNLATSLNNAGWEYLGYGILDIHL